MTSKISKYGFKVKFDHKYPEKWNQGNHPTLLQVWNMIGTIIRYILYSIYILLQGRKPIMNFFSPVKGQQIYGVPIGGIGAGSINRGFKGEFCRYQMLPGIYEYKTIQTNQFILTVHNHTGKLVYQNVLSPYPAPKDGSLSSWKWNFPKENGSYSGLYPRAWYEYIIPEVNMVLICKQISPVIPHNYKDSSIPGCVFIWEVINNSSEECNVSITFTYQNGRGHKDDIQGGCTSRTFGNSQIQSVQICDKMNNMKQKYTVSARKIEDTQKISMCDYFNPKSNGIDIWEPLERNGNLINKGLNKITSKGENLGVAICVNDNIKPKQIKSFEFGLIWTFDEIYFHHHTKKYEHYYMKYFKDKENVEMAINLYLFENYKNWEYCIEDWQKSTLNNPDLPDWYKSCVFNELYYVSDGGTIWFKYENGKTSDADDWDPRKEYGQFAYLEGHEYRMYNTYDVHFYASFALSALWPKLQQVIQMDFHDAVYVELKQKRWIIHSGEICPRKKSLSVPHDLGDPEEEPFSLINAYNIYDVSNWKDLNLKFIISVYRDFSLNSDKRFLAKMYPCALDLMKKSETFDRAKIGIIQNDGFPDQTFDCWTMTGVSAYCGGLYIAALACMSEMSQELNDLGNYVELKSKLDKAVKVYHDYLWTGDYYRFDSSGSQHSDSIMADQLCFYLFIKASRIKSEIIPEKNIKKTLKTIFENNVMKFHNGELGAINGILPNGIVDRFAIQSEEVWTGVTYGLAATMLYEGMTKESWITAGGLYKTIYEKSGLGFETPEGLTGHKTYRSGGYMRPLAVYAMQLALFDRENNVKLSQ